ncbi:MAG: sigma-70 family RNA polymerase sigma factor [Deltaproteobacteria bacterium]|nr:sigma-70 family RNA polymerase sigma factor [Deltaproteobacteria bacterium]
METTLLTDRYDMSDLELADAAGAGEARAARLLVERLMPRVRTTIHYLTPRDRDADDLVQLSLIEILHSVTSFRGECSLEVWSHRIVVRTAMRYLKERRARPLLTSSTEDSGKVDFTTPEDHAERRQLRCYLRALLERLPLEQRTAIVFRYVHSCTPGEIAEITRVPLNTVRERLRVGRKRLRRYLVREPALRAWMERRGQ